MSTLQKKLAEQQKIIEFLASKYEKDTGRKVDLPSSLGQMLGDDSVEQEPEKPGKKHGGADGGEESKDVYSFSEAVELMKLPRAESGKGNQKQPGNAKKKDLKLSAAHMALEKIDLSGFVNKRFSRSGFKELLEGL